MEAMVMSPSGGKAAFLEMKDNTWEKLQNVSGYRGYTKRMFMDRPFSSLRPARWPAG
jgi:hypothetical protein